MIQAVISCLYYQAQPTLNANSLLSIFSYNRRWWKSNNSAFENLSFPTCTPNKLNNQVFTYLPTEISRIFLMNKIVLKSNLWHPSLPSPPLPTHTQQLLQGYQVYCVYTPHNDTLGEI